MNMETANDIAAKIDINNQRVSVIKCCAVRSCGEKCTFQQDVSLPIIMVKQERFLSPSSVVKGSKITAKHYCSFCKKSFKWLSHLQSHERTHTGEKPFGCELCGRSFARSDALQCHKRTHLTTGDLSGHREKNEKAKPVAYKYTPLMAPAESIGKISNVTKEPSQEKLFNCDQRNRIFFSSAGMVKHMQIHKERQNFICEECDKMFSKKSALEVHSRVHTGIKPYRCNICTKAFSIRGNLKRHILIHTGERPYQCSHCSKAFNNASHLSRHLKSIHKGMRNRQAK